jgi:hypothetical protein
MSDPVTLFIGGIVVILLLYIVPVQIGKMKR